MDWKKILKYDNVGNMNMRQFGNRVIDALEALGFEIKYDDYYPTEKLRYYDSNDLKRMRYRGFTNLSDEEMEGYDGSYKQNEFGHELIITDNEEPYAYGSGFGADTMTIKYLPDDYDLYSNPRNEDYPVMVINSFKVQSIELKTQGGKKEIDVDIDTKQFDNSQTGVREFVQGILNSFKKYAQYEEDWGDMTEEEMREERGARAGRRFAAGARSLGYRDDYY